MNKKLAIPALLFTTVFFSVLTVTLLRTNSSLSTDTPLPTSSLINTNTQPLSTQSIDNVSRSFSLSQVSTHNNASSCYSIINGKVYDLTSFINMHQGGASRILGICGADGTQEYNSQHFGERRASNELNSFYLGDLANN